MLPRASAQKRDPTWNELRSPAACPSGAVPSRVVSVMGEVDVPQRGALIHRPPPCGIDFSRSRACDERFRAEAAMNVGIARYGLNPTGMGGASRINVMVTRRFAAM